MQAIAGYRNWARVNPQPAYMHSMVIALCAKPRSDRRDLDEINRHIREAEKKNPHIQKFLTVYVNDIGRDAMLLQRHPQFPPGSIIVKEKLPTADNAAAPELLTVMIKRDKGFNPASGDWEYLVLNGAATKIAARGRLETCQSCHATRKATDFVYRDPYLPAEVRRQLR